MNCKDQENRFNKEIADFFEKEITDIKTLQKGIDMYVSCIKANPFPEIEDKTMYNSISNLKREKYNIGPYSGLSIFEISNRLFSDLVVLDGAKVIFTEPKLVNANQVKGITLLLSNIKGFDLEIRTNNGTVYGEAYNVAPSFFKEKTRYTIKKLRDANKLENAILIFNSDAFDNEGKNEQYIENQNIKYIKCDLENWKVIKR